MKEREKERMNEFVAERLENTPLYEVKEMNDEGVLVAENTDLIERPSPLEIQVLTHPSTSGKMTKEEISEKNKRNARQGRATANVFYGDGEHFRRPLSHKEKHGAIHPDDQPYVDEMLKLRDLERLARGQHAQSHEGLQRDNARLAYFIPGDLDNPDHISIVQARDVRRKLKDSMADFPGGITTTYKTRVKPEEQVRIVENPEYSGNTDATVTDKAALAVDDKNYRAFLTGLTNK